MQTELSDGKRRTPAGKAHPSGGGQPGAGNKTRPGAALRPYLLNRFRPRLSEEARAVSTKDWHRIKKEVESFCNAGKTDDRVTLPVPFTKESETVIENHVAQKIEELDSYVGFEIVRLDGKLHLSLPGEMLPMEDDYSVVLDMNLIDGIANRDLRQGVMAFTGFLMEKTPLTPANDSLSALMTDEMLSQELEDVEEIARGNGFDDIGELYTTIQKYAGCMSRDCDIMASCAEALKLVPMESISSIRTDTPEEKALLDFILSFRDFVIEHEGELKQTGSYYGDSCVEVNPCDLILVSRNDVPIHDAIFYVSDILYDGDYYINGAFVHHVITEDGVKSFCDISSFSNMIHKMNLLLAAIPAGTKS